MQGCWLSCISQHISTDCSGISGGTKPKQRDSIPTHDAPFIQPEKFRPPLSHHPLLSPPHHYTTSYTMATTTQDDWPLSPDEYLRYGRQMIMPEWGLGGTCARKLD